MQLWVELDDAEKDAAVTHFSRINELTPPGEACLYEPTYRAFNLQDTESTRRQLRKHRNTAKYSVPRSITLDYSRMILRVHGDAVIIGDVEIPDHDAEMLEYAMAVGELFGIRKLIINGDFQAADPLSAHAPPPESIGARMSFSDERKLTKQVIRALSKQFTEMYLVEGNHEHRLSRYTDGNVAISELINEFAEDSGIGIKASWFSSIELLSGGKEWLICHPASYRKAPGSLAREIAEIRRKNVVCAHMHHLSESQTKCGQLVALDGGYCRDERRTLYKVASVTSHPKWNPGFVVIRNGYHYLFSKDKTDWAWWLK